jgi:transcriptional regulator with XRE-family HTH domain
MNEQAHPRPPAPDTIAEFVKLARGFARWKQDILAFKAGVSLSTIQRVERGRSVSAEALEKIGAALKQPAGALTKPRLPLDDAQAGEFITNAWGWMLDCAPVNVAPLRKHRQLRALGEATTAIFDDDLPEAAKDDLAGVHEWFELLGFVRAEHSGEFRIVGQTQRDLDVRRLQNDVLAAVSKVERRYRAVCLTRVYEAATNWPTLPAIQVGVATFRSLDNDPAAITRKGLMVPKSIDVRGAVRRAFEADE